MPRSLRSGRVGEMAISTPERDRDRDREATSLPTELPAPLKRRARNTIEQNEHYRRRPLQLDLSADDSDTIQIESSQPIRQTRKTAATNKDLEVPDGPTPRTGQRRISPQQYYHKLEAVELYIKAIIARNSSIVIS